MTRYGGGRFSRGQGANGRLTASTSFTTFESLRVNRGYRFSSSAWQNFAVSKRSGMFTYSRVVA